MNLKEKIIGTLSVAAITAAVFFSTNVKGNAGDIDLTSLVGLNVANAHTVTCDDHCESSPINECDFKSEDANGDPITVVCHNMKE